MLTPEGSCVIGYVGMSVICEACRHEKTLPCKEMINEGRCKLMTDLYHGDCLTGMRMLSDASIDLIYADPPFYTDRDFDSFDDRFDSMEHYINWLKVRLQECHRVLKPTGSIYVHLDWHAVHYVKVMMDGIFGYGNFQNEIIWCYSNSGRGKMEFSKKHDNILLYKKSSDSKWNADAIKIPYDDKYIKSHFKNIDGDGRVCRIRTDAGKQRIYYPESGMIPNDWWTDIPSLNSVARERLGYPTQKPEALLERIIKTSSNKGDTVLDPFCGCGTALAVAQKLGRRWIGIDMSEEAIILSHKRLFGGI